jgi:hypothetical protein
MAHQSDIKPQMATQLTPDEKIRRLVDFKELVLDSFEPATRGKKFIRSSLAFSSREWPETYHRSQNGDPDRSDPREFFTGLPCRRRVMAPG